MINKKSKPIITDIQRQFKNINLKKIIFIFENVI